MTDITQLLNDGEPAVLFERQYGRSLLDAINNDPDIEKSRQEYLDHIRAVGLMAALEKTFHNGCESNGLDENHDNVKFSYLRFSANSSEDIRYPIYLYHQMHEDKRPLLMFDEDDLFPILIGHLGMRLVTAGAIPLPGAILIEL